MRDPGRPPSSPSPFSPTPHSLWPMHLPLSFFEEWYNKKSQKESRRNCALCFFVLLFFYREVEGVHRSTKVFEVQKMDAPMDATCKNMPCPAGRGRGVQAGYMFTVGASDQKRLHSNMQQH